MLCSRATEDPIAREIYKRDGFVLLSRGYDPDDLWPGQLFRTPAGSSGRPSVPVRGETMIAGWPDLEVRSREHRRLARDDVRSEMAKSVAAGASGLLSGLPDRSAEVEAALTTAGVSRLTVLLNGAVTRQFDVAALEDRLHEVVLTELGERYRDRGDRLFVIQETLNVTGATLILDDTKSASALASLSDTVLGKAGLRARADRSRATAVTLDNGSAEEVAIAYRALELDWGDPARIVLLAALEGSPIRGVEEADAHEDADVISLEELSRTYRVATLDVLDPGGSLFLDFDPGA